MPPKKKPKYVLAMEKQIKSLSDMINARFAGDQTSATGGPAAQTDSSAPSRTPAGVTTRSGRGGKQVPETTPEPPGESQAKVPKKSARAASATVSKPTEELGPQDQESMIEPQDQVLAGDQQLARDSERELVTLDRNTIAATVQEVVGEIEHVSDHAEGDCLNPFLLAGTTLDPKIKRRIFAGEYIDLVTLAPKEELPSYSFYTHNTNNAANAKPRQVGNFNEWMRLFIVYASVYGSKYPEQCVPMFNYMLRIYGLSTRQPVSYAWRLYDESFRKLRGFETKLAWHYIHHHILAQVDEHLNIQSMAIKRRSGAGNKGDGPRNNAVKGDRQPGCCYAYNDSSKVCSRQKCPFLHRCSACLGAHPACQCPSRGNKPDARFKPTGGPARSK